jgi:hypothetical protein
MEKHYSVNWKDGELVSIEVDGVEYASLEDIPDEEDRTQIELMMMGEVSKLMVEQPSSGDGMTKVVLGIFLAVGALMLVIFAISASNALRTASREQSAQGRVIELVTRRDEYGNEYYYPVVEYYLQDGSLKRVQIPQGSWPAAYQPGDSVPVRYDPLRPLEARIASAGSADRWILPGVTGFLGVIFTVVALLVGKLFNVRWLPLLDLKKID